MSGGCAGRLGQHGRINTGLQQIFRLKAGRQLPAVILAKRDDLTGIQGDAVDLPADRIVARRLARLLIEALQIHRRQMVVFSSRSILKVAWACKGALCPPSRMERLTTVTV